MIEARTHNDGSRLLCPPQNTYDLVLQVANPLVELLLFSSTHYSLKHRGQQQVVGIVWMKLMITKSKLAFQQASLLGCLAHQHPI